MKSRWAADWVRVALVVKIQGTKTSTQDFPSFPSCKLLACSLPKPRWSRKETAGVVAREEVSAAEIQKQKLQWIEVFEICLWDMTHFLPYISQRGWQILHTPEHPKWQIVLKRGTASRALAKALTEASSHLSPGNGCGYHCRETTQHSRALPTN